MKTFLCAISFLALSAAFADEPTFTITTTKGKVVDVTQAALQASYADMVRTVYNGRYKNEDGSTSFTKPAVMIAGSAHIVANGSSTTDNSALGLCKLRGFSSLVTSEEIGQASLLPTVTLKTDGTPDATYEGAVLGIWPYRSITCR